MTYRAVIFDLGGVVLGSPLQAIAAYERDTGLPEGFVSRVVLESGRGGAWSRLERGELGLEAFYEAFEAECAARGERVCGPTLMERVHASAEPRPAMLEAVHRIRMRALRVAALTNNWASAEGGAHALRPRFDVFIESSLLGLRKPDPRIYRYTCGLLDAEPGDVVFLDDIGANLKPARRMGMTTLKVDDPGTSLRELESLLGFPLEDRP
jgi:putative hydrolase of the HAD superfamily